MKPQVFSPLSIQPVVVVSGLKRQQTAALTNFVGCFLLALSSFFFLLHLSDLTGPSAELLGQITPSIPLSYQATRYTGFHGTISFPFMLERVWNLFGNACLDHILQGCPGGPSCSNEDLLEANQSALEWLLRWRDKDMNECLLILFILLHSERASRGSFAAFGKAFFESFWVET